MKTETIEIPHDKRVNLQHLAIDVKEQTGAELVVRREPQTRTLVDQDDQETVEYLGYVLEVPAEAAKDVRQMIAAHEPERTDVEAAAIAERAARAEAVKSDIREALRDPEFLTEFREKLLNEGKNGGRGAADEGAVNA